MSFISALSGSQIKAKLSVQSTENLTRTNENTLVNFDKDSLPPEPQLGNIEYKYKLTNISTQRFEHLVTQMKWRCMEGHGEAIYEIGVLDSGEMFGLDGPDLSESLYTLSRMAETLGASMSVLKKKEVGQNRYAAEVLIRKVPEDKTNIEVTIAVLGATHAGKSSLLGVLTQGNFDNGRGSARLNMFRHMHEIQTGQTSSVSQEIMGFDEKGMVINYGYNNMITAEEICKISNKIITFMDLAGHRKYLRTTVKSLTGYSPHRAMLVVGSGSKLIDIIREHMTIIQSLKISFCIVITKIDLTSSEQTINDLNEILTSCSFRKVPFLVKKRDDVITAHYHQNNEEIVPIFCVSCVTGEGLALLNQYFYILSPSLSNVKLKILENEPIQFWIDEVFKMSDDGPIVSGILRKGIIVDNISLKIGPFEDGSFELVKIQSIHRNKAPCRVVRAGQIASISFQKNEHLSFLRSGMVLIQEIGCHLFACLNFEAKMLNIFQKKAIQVGAKGTVHTGTIRQTAIVSRVDENDGSYYILFTFERLPEYVIPGYRILFRDGNVKAVGKITKSYAIDKFKDNDFIKLT